MTNAEKMIREDIAKLTYNRYAVIRQQICLDIKYAYWHGFIDDKICNDLHKTLEKRSDELNEQTYGKY